MCDKAVRTEPGSLECIPDHFKTHEMWDVAVMEDPCALEFDPDQFKAQEMCSKTFENLLGMCP